MANNSVLKRALVLGATGFVGSRIVKILEKNSSINEIYCFSRREVAYTSKKIRNHIIDFYNIESYADLFVGDLLFSCLGTTKRKAGSLRDQRIVDIDYQLKAAYLAEKNKVNHYLLISSIGANAKSVSPYLRMKGELEQHIAILDFPKISIFRPSLLMGKRNETRFFESVGAKILNILCVLPLISRFTPIDADTLAINMVNEALG